MMRTLSIVAAVAGLLIGTTALGRSRSRRRPLRTATVTFERRGRSRHAVPRLVWLA